MYLIILIGLVLRLSFINKPEGLWNDEYVSWMVSSTPFGEGFWQEVLKQCHMPFYYLYIKLFSGYSDLVLRLTSVVPSVISIYVMYLVGKEYSKKAGILACSVTSVLSFLIYYSQEVRFYSLLFLFSSLSLLFTIRVIKNASKQNYLGLIVSNFLILFTHVLGIIYVVFDVMYVVWKKRVFSKKFIPLVIFVFLFTGFFGLVIIKQLPASQWWGHFSYTNILFLFSDFFSPILTNNVNAPSVFFYNARLALWMTVPVIIGFLGMIFGFRQNKGIFAVSLCTIVITSVLAISGKIVFISKYLTEILPIFIIMMVCGFCRMKKYGLILFALFIAFHIASVFTPNYVTKLPRNEGHRIVGEILNSRKADNIVFTYYAPDRFYRYFKKRGNLYHISKVNRYEYKDNPERILDKIKAGETVSVVLLDSVSFFPEEYLNLYKDKLPEMFVIFSHIRNVLIEELNNNYSDFIVDRKGYWTVITAKKKK